MSDHKRLTFGQAFFGLIDERPIDVMGVLFHGAIAQLGERLHGMQEVAGSIPAGSTTSLTGWRRNGAAVALL